MSNLPNLVLATIYSTCAKCLSNTGTNTDFSYDLWLSKKLGPTWCGTGIYPWPKPNCTGPGSPAPPTNMLEIMIWLTRNAGNSPVGSIKTAYNFSPQAWLDTGNGEQLENPYFQTYVGTSGGHRIVSFVLADNSNASLTEGLLSGSISLFLNDFVNQALKATGTTAYDSDYLNGLEFGSEIGPTSTRTTDFNFSLSQYCYVIYPSAAPIAGSSAPAPPSLGTEILAAPASVAFLATAAGTVRSN